MDKKLPYVSDKQVAALVKAAQQGINTWPDMEKRRKKGVDKDIPGCQSKTMMKVGI